MQSVLTQGQDRAGQGLGLRTGIAMMGLIEEVANFRVPKHPRIHFMDNVQPMGFQCGNRGLHERDGWSLRGCDIYISREILSG